MYIPVRQDKAGAMYGDVLWFSVYFYIILWYFVSFLFIFHIFNFFMIFMFFWPEMTGAYQSASLVYDVLRIFMPKVSHMCAEYRRIDPQWSMIFQHES